MLLVVCRKTSRCMEAGYGVGTFQLDPNSRHTPQPYIDHMQIIRKLVFSLNVLRLPFF